MAMVCLLKIALGGWPQGKSLRAWFKVRVDEPWKSNRPRGGTLGGSPCKRLPEQVGPGNGFGRKGRSDNRIAEFWGWAGSSPKGHRGPRQKKSPPSFAKKQKKVGQPFFNSSSSIKSF